MGNVSDSRKNVPLGLYISVPFCRHKCSFCNFASGVGTDAAMASYIQSLTAEIRSARQSAERLGALLPEVVDTVYFGGGTPSLLEPQQFAAVFAAMRESFTLVPGAEITLEAAPGQIGEASLEAAMREGVNRVSLGVQSFVNAESAAVGRTHTAEDCFAEFARLREAGMGNVGMDLIAGLPLQTMASWQESLQAVDESDVQHVSVYMLEVDEDSRLGREVLKGGARFSAPFVASEEVSAAMYEQACERLPQAGFTQYEISNFGREGFVSRHNRKYWQRAPYLGLGLDAHSMLHAASGGDLRFANSDDLASYALGSRTLPQLVDADAAFEESVFLGLRMLDGIDERDLRAVFGDRVEGVALAAEELRAEGLMDVSEGRWRLTRRGQLVSNDVFGRLLEDVVAKV